MQPAPFRTITINGKTYNSVEEMPADVRQQYERAMAMLPDKNNNGVPDILEQPSGQKTGHLTSTVVQQRIVINGQEYHNIDDVPPHLRQLLQNATAAHDHKDTGGLLVSRLEGSNQTDSETDGITLHISWSTLSALLVAVLIAAIAVAWWFARHPH